MNSRTLSKKQAEGGLSLQAVNIKASNMCICLLLDRCIGTALLIKFKLDGEPIKVKIYRAATVKALRVNYPKSRATN